MRPWLALVTLTMLAAPAAASQATLYSPSFLATAADAAGSVQVLGNAAVVDVRGFADIPGSAHFQINATSLSMETERGEVIEAAIAGQYNRNSSAPERRDFGAATVRGSIRDNQTALFLVPTGETTIELSSASMALTLPQYSCREQPDFFSRYYPLLCPDVSGSASFAAAGGSMAAVGDFVVHLWSWQGSVESGDQVVPFWSGAQPKPNTVVIDDPTLTQNVGKQVVGETEKRGVSFQVHGRIDVQLAPSQAVDLFSPSVQISAGRVETTQEGQSVGLAQGEMQAERRGDTIAVTVRRGTVTSGGQTLVVATEQPGSSSDWRWALLGLGALPLVVVAARRRNAKVHLRHARENLGLLNFHAAARHAEAALGDRRTHVEAGILGAIALIRSGDLDDARHFVSTLESRGKADRAALTYLQACMAAQSGDLRGARALLADCVARDPRYEAEAAANPILQPLAKRGKVPSGEAYS